MENFYDVSIVDGIIPSKREATDLAEVLQFVQKKVRKKDEQTCQQEYSTGFLRGNRED